MHLSSLPPSLNLYEVTAWPPMEKKKKKKKTLSHRARQQSDPVYSLSTSTLGTTILLLVLLHHSLPETKCDALDLFLQERGCLEVLEVVVVVVRV